MQAGVHTEHFRVRAYETDAAGLLLPQSLCDYLQEAAAVHASLLQVSMTALLDQGLAWVLSRLCVRVHGWPRLGDAVRVETWPTKANRAYACRSLRLLAEDGALLAEAVTAWPVLDLHTRGLARMPQEVLDIHPPEGTDAEAPPRQKVPEPRAVTVEQDFPVRLADLDVNGHVNNAAYVQWAAETVPCDTWETMRPALLDAMFRAEAGAGATVRCQSGPAEDGSFLHRLQDAADGRELARVRSRWQAVDGLRTARTPAAAREAGDRP